jgi:hypothetical protein
VIDYPSVPLDMFYGTIPTCRRKCDLQKVLMLKKRIDTSFISTSSL